MWTGSHWELLSRPLKKPNRDRLDSTAWCENALLSLPELLHQHSASLCCLTLAHTHTSTPLNIRVFPNVSSLTPWPRLGSLTNVVFLSPLLFPRALHHVFLPCTLHSVVQSLFMFPFSPSSSTLSSMLPTLDTISELDLLSDISEDEPDLHVEPDLQLEPDSEPVRWPAGDSSSDEGASEEPHSALGLSVLRFCRGLRLPSLLDEDGYISLPCLPEDCAALLLPAGLHRHLPLSSPSLLPSFLLIFAVFLSACQSVALSLLLALPLALTLCYLEPKTLARFRPAEVTTETSAPVEMKCDPAA